MTIQDMKIEFNKEKTMKKTQTEMKQYQDSLSQWKNSVESLTDRMNHEDRMLAFQDKIKGLDKKKSKLLNP